MSRHEFVFESRRASCTVIRASRRGARRRGRTAIAARTLPDLPVVISASWRNGDESRVMCGLCSRVVAPGLARERRRRGAGRIELHGLSQGHRGHPRLRLGHDEADRRDRHGLRRSKGLRRLPRRRSEGDHQGQGPQARRVLSRPRQPVGQQEDLRRLPRRARRHAVEQPDDDRVGQDPGRGLVVRIARRLRPRLGQLRRDEPVEPDPATGHRCLSRLHGGPQAARARRVSRCTEDRARRAHGVDQAQGPSRAGRLHLHPTRVPTLPPGRQRTREARRLSRHGLLSLSHPLQQRRSLRGQGQEHPARRAGPPARPLDAGIAQVEGHRA